MAGLDDRDVSRVPARPRVLITLGTFFNDEALLAAILSSVAELDVDIVATLGIQLSTRPVEADDIRYEGFRPLAELLPGIDVLVTVGGSGTDLAAAGAGVPMVVIPQGADQPMNAALATAAGRAMTESDPAAVGAAERAVLGDAGFADAARRIKAEVGERPTAAEALGELLRRLSRPDEVPRRS